MKRNLTLVLAFALLAFVSDLEAQTPSWQWSIGMGAVACPCPTYDGDRATSVIVDSAGNMYAAGYFFDTVDVNPGPDTLLFGTNFRSGFIIKFDKLGNFIWAKQFRTITSLSGSAAEAITFDPTQQFIYVAGDFSGSVNLPGSQKLQLVPWIFL